MAKIPTILEAGRADGKLIKTNSVYDDNQETFLSDKIRDIDDNYNNLKDEVNTLTEVINNNESDIEFKLETEKTRATNAENNLRKTINSITNINEHAATAELITVNTLSNSSVSNVQQALNELFKNATFAGIAIPTTNPGIPNSPIFYLANSTGVYTNFNNIEVLNGELTILKWNNNTWTKNTFKPMTNFNSVFNADGKPLTDVLYNLSKRLKGTSEESNAYTDPFISLGDIAGWSAFSDKLDAIPELENKQKYMGRCRARVDGVTVEVYHFINSFSKNDFSQVVFGNVSAIKNEQNKWQVKFTPNNFNIIHRQHKDRVWSDWQRINDHPIATPSLDGLMSKDDKAALDAANIEIASLKSEKANTSELNAAKEDIVENSNQISALSGLLDKTAEKVDTATRILTFATIVENVKIEEQGVTPPFSILYDKGRGFFVANKNMKFYSSFFGSEDYNTISNSGMKARADRLFQNLDNNYFYRHDGTALKQFVISNEERAKLLAYPAKPLDIPTATTTKPGLMSATDKMKLNKTKPVEEVTWTGQHAMNGYTECGEYHIHGERTNVDDGLPILNADPGHTIDATMTVLDSSLTNGTGAKTDICVTQILRMSNRTGGDGHIFIRTGQAATKSQLASGYSKYWGPWEKLMGMFEKNDIDTIEDLDGYTTNGMYSGIYAGTSPKNFYTVRFLPGDTFLMITINGYAVSNFGMTPQITQLLYKLPAKTSTSKQNAEMYIRTGHWNADEKKWVWGTFSKMATNADLSAQVAILTAKINQNAASIASANEAASEALTTSQAAQDAANTASENAGQAQGTATNALSEAIEAKSNAATAFGAASNALGIANAAQTKNDEQDERLNRIENNVAYLGIAGRYWDEDNATSTAENYYGSLQALRDLPKRLGLGRYLVTDDRKRKKLDPKDSTKYIDGSPAALDGSEGQCMWCWNGFYANIWHEGSRLIKAVTFDRPVGGETSVWIPAGGISWLGAGVIDRGDAPYTDKTKWKLCSVINNSEQFRGGDGTAIDATKHSLAPADTTPQITMLGMPATNISTTDFGNYARKRGEGWEANWFVARFVVEFLFEVIMGTENSQEAFNANKDANGLYQGGFGIGIACMSTADVYNGSYPLIPTSVGLEAGDGVCLVPYGVPQTNGVGGDTYRTFNVPVFFGLVGAGFGHLYQLVRGLILYGDEEKSLVYVTPSMYADYNPDTIDDKIMVAECPRVSGFIMRKSYNGLCCMPTEIGGSGNVRYSDYFHTNLATIKGFNYRAAGGTMRISEWYAGVSCSVTDYKSTASHSYDSSPICYFTEDPIIPDSQSIANNS